MSPTSLALAASTCQTDHISVIVLVLNVATHEKEPNQNALSKFDALSVTVVVILSKVNPLVQACKEVSKDKYPEVYNSVIFVLVYFFVLVFVFVLPIIFSF